MSRNFKNTAERTLCSLVTAVCMTGDVHEFKNKLIIFLNTILTLQKIYISSVILFLKMPRNLLLQNLMVTITNFKFNLKKICYPTVFILQRTISSSVPPPFLTISTQYHYHILLFFHLSLTNTLRATIKPSFTLNHTNSPTS